MKNYPLYHTEDFVWDESFRQWVLSPTRENDTLWQQWLTDHPHKKASVLEARELVLAFQLAEPELTDEEINYTVQRTVGRLRKNRALDQPQQPARIIPFYRQTWFRVAAMLTLLLGTGAVIWKKEVVSLASRNSQTIDYEQLVAHKTLTETSNDSPKPKPVRLSDGSLIILKKGSRISYAPDFNRDRREVYLSGEAYFEVTKNPDKPFLIYANGLVTKVLGTSFIIKAYATETKVTVEVKTGRVAVFAQSDPRTKEKISSRELEGVLLMPNQKIVYIRDEVRLAKSLIDDPQLLPELVRKPNFTFEDTPAPDAFLALEKAYELDIVYDEQLLADCPVTATFGDESLFEKLDVICRVIEARYEVIDGQVVIHSRGCKP